MSTTLSIQLFEKYKKDQRQVKEIEKKKNIYEKQLKKREESMRDAINRKVSEYHARIIQQAEKKLAREQKKKQSRLNNDMRAIL